jgi:hypothetical protein
MCGNSPRRLPIAVANPIVFGCGAPDPPRERDLAEYEAHGRARGFDLLLIMLDTVRADRFGCYGRAAAATPVIDDLATRGLRFERVLTTAPLSPWEDADAAAARILPLATEEARRPAALGYVESRAPVTGGPAESEQAVRRAPELQPDAETHMRLTQLLQRRRSYDDCAAQLDPAEKLDPHYGEIHLARSEAKHGR